MKPFLMFLSLVAASSVLPQTSIQSMPALPEVCLPSVPQIPGRSESGPLTSGTSGAGRGVWAPVGVTDEKAEAHSAHFASLDSFAFSLSRGGSGDVGTLSWSLIQWLFGHRALAQVPAGGWTQRHSMRAQPAPGWAAPDRSPGARQSPSHLAAPVGTCAIRLAASSSSITSRPGHTSWGTGQIPVQGISCPSHPCPHRGQRTGERQEAGLLPQSCREPGPGFWG